MALSFYMDYIPIIFAYVWLAKKSVKKYINIYKRLVKTKKLVFNKEINKHNYNKKYNFNNCF